MVTTLFCVVSATGALQPTVYIMSEQDVISVHIYRGRPHACLFDRSGGLYPLMSQPLWHFIRRCYPPFTPADVQYFQRSFFLVQGLLSILRKLKAPAKGSKGEVGCAVSVYFAVYVKA